MIQRTAQISLLKARPRRGLTPTSRTTEMWLGLTATTTESLASRSPETLRLAYWFGWNAEPQRQRWYARLLWSSFVLNRRGSSGSALWSCSSPLLRRPALRLQQVCGLGESTSSAWSLLTVGRYSAPLPRRGRQQHPDPRTHRDRAADSAPFLAAHRLRRRCRG